MLSLAPEPTASLPAWLAGGHPPSSKDQRPQRLQPLFDAAPIQVQTRGVTSHAATAELWPSRFTHKASIASKLRAAGAAELAGKLDACHTIRSAIVCRACGRSRPVWNRCDQLLCPVCQPRLARRRAVSIAWWAATIRQPKHIVLTVRNLPVLDRAVLAAFKQSIQRLRRAAVARRWRGGCWSVEVTNEGRGWHLHAHLLIDADWVPAAGLEAAWHRATAGGGYICRVYDCRGKDYLREVTKYAVKGSQSAGWEPAQLAQFAAAFSRARTFGVFGSLFRRRAEWRKAMDELEHERELCECGACAWAIMTPEEAEVYEPWNAPANRPAAPPQPEPEATLFDRPSLALPSYRCN